MPSAEHPAQGQAPAFLRKDEPRLEPRTEAQLREDQRREALARRDEAHAEEPRREELRAAPFPAEPAQTPPPPRVEEPKIDSKALLESSGLVMIETDRAKAPVQPAVEEEPQHLGRPRRERPKRQPQEEELQQVETRK
jgi:hypothetical protein